MTSAAITALTHGLTLVSLERHNGYCKAAYSDGRKLIITHTDAAELSSKHNVKIVNAR